MLQAKQQAALQQNGISQKWEATQPLSLYHNAPECNGAPAQLQQQHQQQQEQQQRQGKSQPPQEQKPEPQKQQSAATQKEGFGRATDMPQPVTPHANGNHTPKNGRAHQQANGLPANGHANGYHKRRHTHRGRHRTTVRAEPLQNGRRNRGVSKAHEGEAAAQQPENGRQPHHQEYYLFHTIGPQGKPMPAFRFAIRDDGLGAATAARSSTAPPKEATAGESGPLKSCSANFQHRNPEVLCSAVVQVDVRFLVRP